MAQLDFRGTNHHLVVEVIGRNGKLIATKGPLRTPVGLTSVLDLTPW